MGHWNVEYLGSRERAENTRTFAFKHPGDLAYEPGQFLYLVLPGPDGADVKWMEHHFSFSSSPTEPRVEITTRLTGSAYKDRLLSLEPGTVVRLAAPDGDFVLRPGTTRAAYVCGGVGVTPARSTIRWALDTDAGVDIVLLYANRDLASAAFHEEFEAIRSDRVRVVDVLSHPAEGWSGLSGHIDGELVRAQVPDWAERLFFVSGPPGMTGALTQTLLNDVGVASDHVIAEYFTGYQ